MISIEEALKIVRQNLPPRRIAETPLRDALGRILAEKIHAPEPLPRFNNSAMDGYAVSLPENFSGKLPLVLPVVGESQAGLPYRKELAPGEAILISTGAVVPGGTSRVVPVEDTDGGREKVKIERLGASGNHIRRRGEEIRSGEVIAAQGSELTSAQIAWLSSFGIQIVKVFAPPRVAILTTGQELVEAGREPGEGQIRNSNQIFFENFLGELNIVPVISEIVPDSEEATRQTIARAREAADIILISGGVSVGPHDHVKKAAEKLGFERKFWKVRQKPGKPLFFAAANNALLFGLPGNPLSALMSCLLYVTPVIRFLLGFADSELQRATVSFQGSVSLKTIKRDRLLLVRVTGRAKNNIQIMPVDRQQSHMLSGVTRADGFVIVPGDRNQISPDQKWEMLVFPWRRRFPGNIFPV